jgi:hypothetical protein
LSFTFLPRWLHNLVPASSQGQIQIMSDVLLGCETLMKQSKVQFVLSHAHEKAVGALDTDTYRCAQVGSELMVRR